MGCSRAGLTRGVRVSRFCFPGERKGRSPLPWFFNTITPFLHFYFSGGPHHVACRILVPQPGIEPKAPAVEVWCLSHWTVTEVPHNTLCSKGFWQRPLGSVGLAWLLSLTQS